MQAQHKTKILKRIALILIIVFVVVVAGSITWLSVSSSRQNAENETLTSAAAPDVVVPDGCTQTDKTFVNGGGDGARALELTYTCNAPLQTDVITSALKPGLESKGYTFDAALDNAKKGKIAITYDIDRALLASKQEKTFNVTIENYFWEK